MNTYVTDTHSLIWYITDNPALSSEARQIFEQTETGNAKIIISTITIIEIIYLVEKKKIPPKTLEALINKLDRSINYELIPITFEIAIAIKDINREIVPDMPDRIIVATAKNTHSTLITKDANIEASGVIKTLW